MFISITSIKDLINVENINTILGTTFKNVDEIIKECDDDITIMLGSLFANKFVPAFGNAETVGGEVVRALERIIYRYYNDGDVPGFGYGVNTVASSLGYIIKEIPEIEFIVEQMIEFDKGCKEFDDLLCKLTVEVILNLINNTTSFKISNNDDSSTGYDYMLFNDYKYRQFYLDVEDSYSVF